MDNMERILTRKSVRTFDGRRLSTVSWDVQKIDLGIAVCHFMTAAGGRFAVKDPGIACGADTEYIATVTVEPIG